MPPYEQVHLAVERMPPGPWVYARLTDDYGPEGPAARDGSIVEVIDRAGRFCGHALYNSTSDIRLRMLSRGRRSDLDRPRQHIQRLIAAALRLRRRVLGLDNVTDAYRIVHAEGDDLSGLIVDKLGDALVCQYHSLGFWELREMVGSILQELLPGHAVLHRFARTARGAEGFPESDPGRDGDEVEPRYIHEEPLARADQAARENNANVEVRHADAFDMLREVSGGNRRPGLVILDPHKLAKGTRDLEAAKIKYRDLNSLGIAATAPGGLLATFSCSGALDLPGFAGLIFQAARRAERDVRLLETMGASHDHPQRPDFGRSRYLKGLLLAVD